jgi:hypothetical protein
MSDLFEHGYMGNGRPTADPFPMSVHGQILLQKSKIEQPRKSRECRFLVASAAATPCRSDTAVCGRFCVKRRGPSRRHMNQRTSVLKKFVRQSKKTFSTLSGT